MAITCSGVGRTTGFFVGAVGHEALFQGKEMEQLVHQPISLVGPLIAGRAHVLVHDKNSISGNALAKFCGKLLKMGDMVDRLTGDDNIVGVFRQVRSAVL